ncbi:MAG: hypothetical protein HOY78_15980 [Saccharothrix sp.]|nr:hypothetical protein [Saccharothrix sp.]
MTTPAVPAHTVDPRTMLSEDELAAARANVAAAPRLSPKQLDVVSSVFRPYVRSVLTTHLPA